MMAGDHKLERTGECPPPLTRLNSTRRRMVDPAWSAFEARPKCVRVFPEIMQQTGDVAPLAGAELGRVGAREDGDLVEMLVQKLPVGAVRPAGGMGETSYP